MYPRLLIPLALAAMLGLAGCDTAEERAQAHYETAKELLAEGKVAQAIVEFRNVFKLDGENKAARLDYANLMVEQGNIQEAIGQYLRLVEQDWGNVAGHKRLAGLALEIQDFDTAETHADRAYELDPKDPEIRAYKATVDYHAGKRAPAVEMAKGVLDETPDNLPARMILIADRMQNDDLPGALTLVDTALKTAPENQDLHLARLAVLQQIGDRAPVGEELVRMAALFPDNDAVGLALIRWHLQDGDIDAAEPLLRARAAAAPAGPERVAADLALVQALYQTRGSQASRAELDRLIAAADDPIPYRRALAALDVREGRTEAGIAALRSIIDETEPSDDRRNTQVALAGILKATGDTAGSDALVDAVLAEDATQVAALKLRAERLIDADEPDAAIRDLRTALNQEPRDSETLTLMAMAHEREGARALAGERLAMAVEVSDKAPAESVRYARFLMQDGKLEPAASVIAEAQTRRPDDPDLLVTLGQIRVAQKDWVRAGEVAASLRATGAAGAADRATALEAQILSGQNRYTETIAMLEKLSGEADGDHAALPDIVQTYVRAGDLDGARSYIEGVRKTDPDAPLPRLMLAGLDAVGGDAAAAEAGYRGLIADAPDYAPAYQGLYQLLLGTGQAEAADAALEAGLAATDEDSRLLFIEAGRREAAGDIDGAIAAYETLYGRDSSSDLVANNLASLLSSHRTDDASQERAFALARRLRDSDVPYFQDTYGWILLQRGETADALAALEKAAAALPDAPLVLYHLGVAQARGDQPDAAAASLERALGLATPETPADAMAAARDLLAQIRDPADAAPKPATEP